MKILIIKASAGGDIVQALSVYDYLKKKFPECEIDWVVEKRFKDLLPIPNIIVMDTNGWRKHICYQTLKGVADFVKQLRSKRYDHVIDLQGNSKSGFVMWLAKSRYKVGYDRSRVMEWPNLLASNKRYPIDKGLSRRKEYLQLAARHFGDDQIDQAEVPSSYRKSSTVLICPFSNWSSKEFKPKIAIELMERIHKFDGSDFVVVWGSDKEREKAQEYCQRPNVRALSHKHTIADLSLLMDECRALIAVDSLPLHLAARTSCPILSLFGPSASGKFAPDRGVALQGTCPYGQTFGMTGRCSKLRSCTDHPCMTSWSVDELFDGYRRLLQEQSQNLDSLHKDLLVGR